MLEHQVIDAASGLEGFLRDLGGGLVADVRVQGGDDADGMLDHLVAVVGIDGDAVDALGAQGVHRIDEPGLAFEDALGDDGLHDVELELAGLGGEGDGGVVADDLEAHLVRDLGDDGVHLARHDGGTRGHRREVDLVEAAAGTGGHQAEVVADLGELDSQALEGGGVAHVGTGVRGGFHQVGGLLEGVTGEFAHALGAEFREAGDGVEAGADGGSAHVDLLEEDGVALEVRELFREVVGEGVEFLSGGHRDGVLQLGAAHLDDVLEFLTLGPEGGDQVAEGLLHMLVHADERVAEGAGIGVVRGLGAVHVVVRGAVLVLTLLVPHQFQGAVGDHLVGIHVHGGAGAALHHVHGELVVELAVDNLPAGGDDRFADLLREDAEFGIGGRGGHLHVSHRDDVLGIVAHPRGGNLIVVECPLRLDTVVSVGGNLKFSQKVGFDPVLDFAHG